MRFDPLCDPHWELPVVAVRLGSFFLSKYEVTQAQWSRMADGEQPSYNKPGISYQDGLPVTVRHPVDSVSWNRATEVLSRYGLDLPTECQWEHACRAGTETRWFTGDDVASLQGYANIMDRTFGNYQPDRLFEAAVDDGFISPAAVGSLLPNRFGLHEMAGNVAEWCKDLRAPYTIPARPGDGLRHDSTSQIRAVRGGCSLWPSRAARSSERNGVAPGEQVSMIGLRPVRGLRL